MNGNTPLSPLPASAFAFSGSHVRSVDVKGRFNLPFKFLHGGNGPEVERFMVARRSEKFLSLVPESVWTDNINRLRQKYSGDEMWDYVRKINAKSTEVAPDSQGRIAVGKETLLAWGIDKKIEIVGMGDRMELWDPAALAKANAVEVDFADFDKEFFR